MIEPSKQPDQLRLLVVENDNVGEEVEDTDQDAVAREIAEANKLMLKSANVEDPAPFHE